MRRFIPIVVLAVLLTGCKVKIDQGFELKSDGSGTATLVFGFDEEITELMGSFSQDGDLFEQTTTDLPAGWDSKEWSEGDFSGLEASTEFGNLADLRSIAALVFGGEDGLFEDFLIEDTADGGFRFEASLSGETLEEGLQSVEGFDLGGSLDQMSETFFEAQILVKLPGTVVSHNADQKRSDGTLVWDVRLSDAGRVINAESEPGGGLPLIPIAAGAAVVLVAVLGFVLLKQRSSVSVNDELSNVISPIAVPAAQAVDGDPFG